MESSKADSRPPSITQEDEEAVLRAKKMYYRQCLFSLLWCFFAFGLNDGSLGPLIPAYQRYYRIGFITVSLIFIFNCIGFVAMSVLNVLLSSRINFSKLLTFGAICQLTAYSILASAPPFPLVCFAVFLLGSGLALLNAHGNGFMSMLENSTEMGFAHASYGAGALVSPLIATQFSKFTDRKWAFHYLFLLGSTLISLSLIVYTFRGKGYDVIMKDIGLKRDGVVEQVEMIVPPTPAEDEVRRQSSEEEGEPAPPPSPPANVKKTGMFATIMKQTPMHLMASFVFVYVGVEVTIGGWIVTFIIQKRGGGPSSGYVNSGFFGGLAAGRVVLLWINKLVGEKLIIYIYIVIGIALEFTIWFVPSLIGNAVAVSFVGLVLGPMYPIVMSQAGRIIPRKLLPGSIGWISGFGGTGSAALPFITGALAARWGIQSLQPLIVIMMVIMAVLWFLVPNPKRREE
ncbi:MFS general substrate transporter [Serendipita vermifera]|nr:MFS general substrate transporter [Serendipita vermifera]